MDAEGSDQVEAAGQDSGHCANGVNGVEHAEIRADHGEPPDNEACEDGQCRSHEEGRQHDEAKGQDEAHRCECRRGMSRDLIEREIHGRNPRKQKVYGERRKADADLQDGIEAKRIGAAVRRFSEEPAAKRKSRHERCQHHAHGSGRRAEYMREHSDPDDLVDEAACAGEEEKS